MLEMNVEYYSLATPCTGCSSSSAATVACFSGDCTTLARLIRPPDIVCRRTYILPVFLLSFFLLLSFFFFFAGWSPRSLNGTERKSATWSEVSVIYKRMSAIWDTPPLANRGPKNHLFGRLCNLTALLTAYIFETKHDIDNLSSALTTTRCLVHCPKMSWTLVYKQLQTRPAFLPTLCKFRIPLHCQASQTEISKWNSTTLCQTVDRGRSNNVP